MDQTAQQILLQLLSRTLNKSLHHNEENELSLLGSSPSRQLWLRIITIAEQQQVNGLLFDAIPTLPSWQRPDTEVMMRFTASVVGIENSNRAYRTQLFAMFGKLRQDNLDPILLKGLTLANLYPQPDHRPVGDIDLFVTLDRQHQYLQCFANDGASIRSEFDVKHTSFQHRGMNWELHFRSTYFYNLRSEHLYRILEAEDSTPDMLCHENIDGNVVTVFPPLLNMVYLTAHIQHHLILEQITLRNVIDWMLALHHERTALGIGEVALIRQLERLNLLRLYRAIGYIAVTRLGFAADSYAGLSRITKRDARRGEYLLRVIMQGNIPGCRPYSGRSSDETAIERALQFGELVRRCLALRHLCPRECLSTPFGFAANAIRRRLAKH